MYTIYTDAVFTEEAFNSGVFFSNEAKIQAILKINPLIGEGKTDGVQHLLPPNTVRRFWADYDSANQWVTFANELNIEYPGKLISIDIHTLTS